MLLPVNQFQLQSEKNINQSDGLCLLAKYVGEMCDKPTIELLYSCTLKAITCHVHSKLIARRGEKTKHQDGLDVNSEAAYMMCDGLAVGHSHVTSLAS